MTTLTEKHGWRLVKYGYKDSNGRNAQFIETDGALLLELAFFALDKNILTIRNGDDVVESFNLSGNMAPVNIGFLGDSMMFMFSDLGGFDNLRKHIRVRFASSDDALACKTLLEKLDIYFLPEPQTLVNTFNDPSQGTGIRSLDKSQTTRIETQANSSFSDTDDKVLQVTVQILLQDPRFPEFVSKVEAAAERLNIFSSVHQN